VLSARTSALGGCYNARPMPVDETSDESQRTPELTLGAVPGVVVIWAQERPAELILRLVNGRLDLGRAEQEELFASDDRVSREHCRVEFDGTGWTVTDLDSRNGTFLNGVRVEGQRSTLDLPLIRVGRCLLWGSTDTRPFQGGVTVEHSGVVLGGLLRRAWAEIELLGRAGSTLCLRGESGSGKELAARAFHDLHRASASAPFIGVNCAAVPEGLAERLLFGARKGAFSGATGDVQGYIQAADGGTLFLDEVAELDLRVQAKLLRVLETREVLRLGATRAEPVELRVCVAAHADLAEQVTAGRFREDLYYRIGRPVVWIPPLRARLDEMAWLIHGEVTNTSPGLSASFRLVEGCATRAWPGNVRELIGEVRRAAHRALRAERGSVDLEDLAEDAGKRLEPAPAPAATAEASVSAPPSDEAIERALQAHAGNVTQAARALGMHRNQLRRWLSKRPLTAQRLPRDEP
jgi:transcriptional regulator with AAA-type ATPase domain